MTTATRSAAPLFQVRSHHSMLRGLAVAAVCVAIVSGFVVHVLSGPAPEQLRRIAEPASIHLRA